MRKQVRTATEVLGIFAKGVLECFTNAQDSIGFHKRKPKLVIANELASPLVCRAVFYGFAQVPVIDLPDSNTTCRESCIKAVHAKHKAASLVRITLALALGANAVFKDRIKAIGKDLADFSRIFILLSFAEIDFHLAVLVP